MKKTAFILRLVATGLFFALGLTVFILGLSSSTGFYGGYYSSYDYKKPSYEYYGGDAYTGIQNAAVDTANNVARAGADTSNAIASFHNSMNNQMDNIYIWAGVALMIVAIYLFGCTLSAYEPKAKKVQNELPLYNTPQIYNNPQQL